MENECDIQFDPFYNLQTKYNDLLNINIDTLYLDTGYYSLCLHIHLKESCKSTLNIFKSRRVRNAIMDSILPTCTTDIDYVGLDGLKQTDVKRPLRSEYSLHTYNDSVVYELIWKGPLKNEQAIAKDNLFILKNYMGCQNKTCADLYIDSLRKMCIKNYYVDGGN